MGVDEISALRSFVRALRPAGAAVWRIVERDERVRRKCRGRVNVRTARVLNGRSGKRCRMVAAAGRENEGDADKRDVAIKASHESLHSRISRTTYFRELGRPGPVRLKFFAEYGRY